MGFPRPSFTKLEWFAVSFDPMTDPSQRFYPAIAQLQKKRSRCSGKTEVEPKGAVAQTLKSGKKKGLLDGVKLK
jgi:hypothetical protein